LQLCFAIADFWQKIGQMSKADALVQLEKFFYKGLEHNGVKLPAVINFAHYTHGTGQVRSSLHTQNTWQLREFKTDINSQGEGQKSAIAKHPFLPLLGSGLGY
jgi:hypothetical protein